ncbi:hypothetical protein E4U59_003185 [Claviceps monticola]|nr:hypothetical protein E4U59_003185 [Claviceps monticola]
MASDFGGGDKAFDEVWLVVWQEFKEYLLKYDIAGSAVNSDEGTHKCRRKWLSQAELDPKANLSNVISSSIRCQPKETGKHVLNAQVSIRSPCCRKWFDCAECHAEQEKHPLLQSFELIFACKKCKKCFRKDTKEFEESDEYCPHCDNHFVIDAKTPKAALSIESEDVRVNNKMLRDERVKQQGFRTMFDPDEDADKLG